MPTHRLKPFEANAAADVEDAEQALAEQLFLGRAALADRVAAQSPLAAPQITLLKARHVARVFGVAERTLRRWVAVGHLPAIRVGRSVFFAPDAVNALLSGQMTASMPAIGMHTRQQIRQSFRTKEVTNKCECDQLTGRVS